MTHLQAGPGRVLVVLDNPEEQTPGGIIIPENARKNTVTGTVQSVGKDVREDAYKEGSKVLLESEYSGAEIRPSLVSVFEHEILAVLN